MDVTRWNCNRIDLVIVRLGSIWVYVAVSETRTWWSHEPDAMNLALGDTAMEWTSRLRRFRSAGSEPVWESNSKHLKVGVSSVLFPSLRMTKALLSARSMLEDTKARISIFVKRAHHVGIDEVERCWFVEGIKGGPPGQMGCACRPMID
jgi:hypothetical protein